MIGALTRALRRGAVEWRLLLWRWLAALVASLPVALPAWWLFAAHFGRSRLGHDDRWIPDGALYEIGTLFERHGAPLGGALVLALLLATVSQLVLAGGIVGRLWYGGRPSRETFAADCVRHAGRMLRLWGWMLLALVPLLAVATLLALLVDKLAEHAMLASSLVKWELLRAVVMGALLTLWRAAHDAARVMLVADELRSTRRACLRGIVWVVRRPRLVVGYLAVAAVGAGVTLLLAAAHAHLGQTSTGAALFALLVAQIVVVSREWTALATTSFIVDRYREQRGGTPVRARQLVEAAVEVEPDPRDEGIEPA